MVQRRAAVVLEHQGEASSLRSGLSAEAVVRTVRGLAGGRDVTVTITTEGVDERLMIAVDRSRAFVGLERPDGLFQFVSGNDDQQQVTQPPTIGGQGADIESRYL